MTSLHPVQKRLIALLKENLDSPLTIRELRDELGVSSTSTVFHHIKQLEKNGYLKRNPSNPRDYHLIMDNPEKPITYLNLYGLASCGPDGVLLDGDPEERIPISSKLLSFKAEDAFLVRAKGDSMEPRIFEGDLVIIKQRNDAKEGDIVLCVNDEKTMIKRIHYDKNDGENRVLLLSLNNKYVPILAETDLSIVGIVKGVLSYSI